MHDVDAEAARVGGLIDDLFSAMDAQDLDRFRELNARDPDVVHVGTDADERWVGWETLAAATEDQFRSLESFRVSHRQRHVKVLGSGDVACFSQVMDIRTRDSTGTHRLEAARLTGVAEKRDGQWVLVQTHLSLPSG